MHLHCNICVASDFHLGDNKERIWFAALQSRAIIPVLIVVVYVLDLQIVGPALQEMLASTSRLGLLPPMELRVVELPCDGCKGPISINLPTNSDR